MRNRLITTLLASGIAAMSFGAAFAQEGSVAQTVPAVTDTAAASQGTSTGTPAAAAAQPTEGRSVPVSGTSTQPVAQGAAPASDNSQTDSAITASSFQTPPNAYLVGDDRLAPTEIEAWLLAPRSVIEETPLVAERTSARVTRLLGTDQRTVPPMIQLAVATDTNPEQRAMIAVGFAQATRDAEPVAPEYAAYLQEAVARSGSEALITAFNVAFQTTEIQTSSINGPAGGRGGAGAGSLNGGGDSGISGSVGGSAVVETTSPASGSRNSLAAVGDDDDGDGDDGAVGPAGPAGPPGPAGPGACNDASPTTPGCASI
ncbi:MULTISPECIES: hypothetical protein [unclassified Aureimonas]|uniref:hypothetical protein n=1 Tax=unclassified Aureimonas TaxID=2615206 RepID=UPI000AC52C8E|nr:MULTISPECIES: hypothetical protein [unclassified Aureimonas]